MPGTRDLLSSTDTAGAAGSDEADLLAGRAVAANSGRVANVLMVTTTVRVLHWVHCHTTNLWPLVTLDSVLVECTASLKERLVCTSTTSDNAYGCTALVAYGLLGSGRKSNASGSLVFIVVHDNCVVTGALGELSTISWLCLNVAHDGTLRHGVKREDIANTELGLLSAVNKLTSVSSLNSNEKEVVALITVCVLELHLSNWCSSSWFVNDILDDTLCVALTLSEVKCSQLARTNSILGVTLENGALTLTTSSNNFSHGAAR